MEQRDKEHIIMLMNIMNFFGEHQGRLGPVLIFLGISATPFILWVMIFARFIPFKIILIFEVIWTACWALEILGDGKGKQKQYDAEENNVYNTADKMIRLNNISEDGLMEYSNGQIAYIISGFLQDFKDDASLEKSFRKFLEQLRGYDYDIHSHMVVDEFRLQDQSEKLAKYTDKEMIQERMSFYKDQDEYCRDNSELFRINVLVKGSKYTWKELKIKLDKLVKSDNAKCFIQVKVCNRSEVNDVLSRDTTMRVNTYKMLVEKYDNDEFFGSKVLYYGDETPEEFKPKRDSANMRKRRVVYVEDDN